MYKNVERKVLFLLDKVLIMKDEMSRSGQTLDLSIEIELSSNARKIEGLLKKNNDIFTDEMLEKLFQVLSFVPFGIYRVSYVELLADKRYDFISPRLAKLLDVTDDPYFNYHIIVTLYKMNTICHVKEVQPFIEENVPNYLRDEAKKYIKRATKLKKKI